MSNQILLLPQRETPESWWLDLDYRGGVLKRVGWWEDWGNGYDKYFCVAVFTDGTRTPKMSGWMGLRKRKKNG